MSDRKASEVEAGAIVRAARKAKGLSQEQVAEGIGVDQSKLSKAERLGPGAVGLTRFHQLAKFLGCEQDVKIALGKE